MATKEYCIAMPAEDVWYAVEKMGEFMGIPVNAQAIYDALDIDVDEEPNNPDCAVIFYDPSNHNNVIVADCGNFDFLQMVVVRCEKTNHKIIHDRLLHIDTIIRKRENQHLNTSLSERTGQSSYSIHYIEKKYGIKI